MEGGNLTKLVQFQVSEMSLWLFQDFMNSVHPSPLLSAGGGEVEPPTKFFKKEGLDGTSTFRGGCWQRGRGNLKSEIFNNKKSL